MTPLDYAVANGWFLLVSIEYFKILLFFYLHSGNEEVVDVLIENGANIKAKSDLLKWYIKRGKL